MLTPDEARDAILGAAALLKSETVSLENAAGRVLAEEICARVTQPPFAASAMDGYAVRFADVREVGVRLKVIGEARAGDRFGGGVGEGEAVRIFTGGVVPPGADHVLIQEEAAREGDDLNITVAQAQPAHIRKAGVDFSEGDVLIVAGKKLTPLRLALAAAANRDEFQVIVKPKVAIIASGDELIPPGQAPGPNDIINSTPYGLSALIESWGGEAVFHGVARDSESAISEKIKGANEADIVVPLGGASVGDYDLMKPVFGAEGWTLVFEKAAVKPGKPIWLARKENRLALGLPGNPASALVTAFLFLKPLIFKMLSRSDRDAVPEAAARLLGPIRGNGSRESYLRGVYSIDDAGALHVRAFKRQDSSLLTPFADANCLVRQMPQAPALGAGDVADILLLDRD